jgi:hypothetical protein
MTAPATHLGAFERSYLETALWAETQGDSDRSFDADFGIVDFAPETLERMLADCQEFTDAHWDIVNHDLVRAGGDFWLTRNRHGVGFWDGDWGDRGDALTAAARAFGEVYLYMGDDGLIYMG